MQNRQIKPFILDTHAFREVMREFKELRDISRDIKYSLESEENWKLYEVWAPYVMGDYPSTMVNSPGFKIHFFEVTSMMLALKDEKNNKDRFKANEIKQEFNDIKEIKWKQASTNVIDFLEYKGRKVC